MTRSGMLCCTALLPCEGSLGSCLSVSMRRSKTRPCTQSTTAMCRFGCHCFGQPHPRPNDLALTLDALVECLKHIIFPSPAGHVFSRLCAKQCGLFLGGGVARFRLAACSAIAAVGPGLP